MAGLSWPAEAGPRGGEADNGSSAVCSAEFGVRPFVALGAAANSDTETLDMLLMRLLCGLPAVAAAAVAAAVLNASGGESAAACS